MVKAQFHSARLYDSLRTAHLERAHLQAPATIYFRSRRYDFDSELAVGLDLIQARLPAVIWSLLRSSVQILEVNEPLQRSGLVRSWVLIRTGALIARLHGRRLTVVSYAIENKDPYAGRGPKRLKSRLRWLGERYLSQAVASRVDRLAFGTPGAAQLYSDRLGRNLSSAVTATIPAVPAACNCKPNVKEPNSVLYLGAFSDRKGFPQMVEAWPVVAKLNPAASLLIVGKGALQDLATEVAEGFSSVSLKIDPPRQEVHAALRASAVLVLLSQPSPTWREQIGLPLLEAISHGCAVVTSTETGMADWFAAAGNTVLVPSAGPSELGGAIVDSLNRFKVSPPNLGDLPARDGRLLADDWLFGSESKPTSVCTPDAPNPSIGSRGSSTNILNDKQK